MSIDHFSGALGLNANDAPGDLFAADVVHEESNLRRGGGRD